MASTAPRNHWWHVPLYVDVRGLTTRRLHSPGGTSFQIDFDFVDHRLVVRTNGGAVESFALVDGLSVAAFDAQLARDPAPARSSTSRSSSLPFGVQTTTPFPADDQHAAYDREAVERFWRILEWTDGMFEQFAGWYCGKTSPVHLFWHSFDLAVTRFEAGAAHRLRGARRRQPGDLLARGRLFRVLGGRLAPARAELLRVRRSRAAGSPRATAPAGAAHWVELGSGSLAVLPYENVRTAADPRATSRISRKRVPRWCTRAGLGP